MEIQLKLAWGKKEIYGPVQLKNTRESFTV